MPTTIEILAPYLPYGIDVENTEWGSRRRLVGLQAECGLKVSDLVSVVGAGDIHPSRVLPVLYSFADLCTPLPDGTVPAVEVMRHEGYAADRLEVGDVYKNIIHFNIDGQRSSLGLWRSVFGGGCKLATAAYLRRHHFAVGLTPDQFIRKTA